MHCPKLPLHICPTPTYKGNPHRRHHLDLLRRYVGIKVDAGATTAILLCLLPLRFLRLRSCCCHFHGQGRGLREPQLAAILVWAL